MKIILTPIPEGKSFEIELDPECPGMYIVVDLSRLVSTTDRDAWRIINGGLFIPNQSGNFINVDPAKLLDEEIKTPGFYLSWLQTNQHLINFPRSSDFLKCGHTLSDDDIQFIEGLPIFDELSLSEFKALINRPINYFDTVKYERHVCLFDDSGRLGVETTLFRQNYNCFSFPLLRAIVGNATNATFIFKQFIETPGKPPIIVFLVRIGLQTFGYYNFTKIPPLTED